MRPPAALGPVTAPSAPPSEARTAEPDLHRLVAILWRRKWSIIAGTLAVLGFVAVQTKLAPVVYTSTTTILVEASPSSGARTLSILDRVGQGGDIDTELLLLRSRRVMEQVVDELDLHLRAVTEAGSARPAAPTDFRSAVSATMRRVTAVQADPDGRLIRVTCSGASAATARELCDAVRRSYIGLRTELQRAAATTAYGFLRAQLDRVAERLSTAEDSLALFERSTGAVALPVQAAERMRQLIVLRGRRDLLEAERRSLGAFLSQIEADDARSYRELASSPSFLENAAVAALVAALIQLETRRSQVAVARTERNADLAAIIQRIEQIEAELGAIAIGHRAALAARIASLDSTIAEVRGRVAALPALRLEQGRLARATDQLRQLYALLQRRLREADLAREVEMPGIQVVDVASLPAGPSSPDVKKNLAFGLALGLAFGITLGFLREHQDRRLAGRLQVEAVTGLPVLGVLPDVRPTAAARAIGRVVGRDVSREAIAAAIETFHGLATDLRLVGRDRGERGIRSIAVTSAVQGEGKTTAAVNLALVNASYGHRTLIIDADLRAGQVARCLGLSPSGAGLREVLAGEEPPERIWQEVSVGETGRLTALSAGQGSGEHPAWLLDGPAFAALLARTAPTFDLVVVDTPALDPVSDAASVAAAVDAVLFVVRSERTDPELVRVSLSRLMRATRSVLGVVLNGVPLRERAAASGHEYAGFPVKRSGQPA